MLSTYNNFVCNLAVTSTVLAAKAIAKAGNYNVDWDKDDSSKGKQGENRMLREDQSLLIVVEQKLGDWVVNGSKVQMS